MEEQEELLSIINSVSTTLIDDEYSFLKFYYTLRNEYPNFTFEDMIVICKINKLKGLKLISEKTHNYLIDLYKRKIDIEYYLCVYDLTEEETQNYESELIEINNYLEKYDLLPNVSFDNLIEKSVKKIDYSSLNDNKAMSLTPLKK